jgi:hypothetical protein
MNRTQRLLLASSTFGLLFAVGLVASGQAPEDLLRRYPFDPACPWGRVSNGKGMLVRCVTEAEASGLKASTPAQTAPTPAASSTPAPASTAAATPTVGSTDVDADTKPTPGVGDNLEVTVGPVTADSGQLGLGKLAAPKDRYAKCVQDNGGLSAASGEVHVRFLVRARGRAEGVSVAKRQSLSAEAARCVAEVVDRRYVGVPDEPMVGATLLVKFSKVAR